MAHLTKHFWIGLFDAEDNLRDNFLMYIGTDPVSAENYYCASLCELGKIKHEYLFHGDCQILAKTKKGLANFASVKPFITGDYFRLVDNDEHEKLVGLIEHHSELLAINKIRIQIQVSSINSLSTHNRLSSNIPPLDGLLNLVNTPQWLINYSIERIRSDSLFEIAELVGFLSRTGDNKARDLGSDWSKSLTKIQLKNLSSANAEKMRALTNATIEVDHLVNEYPNISVAKEIAMILIMRDEVESVLWVMKQADYNIAHSLVDFLDNILLSRKLSPHKSSTINCSQINQILDYLHKKVPTCWWASCTNF